MPEAQLRKRDLLECATQFQGTLGRWQSAQTPVEQGEMNGSPVAIACLLHRAGPAVSCLFINSKMGLESLFQKIAVPKAGNIYQSQVTLRLDFVGCVSSE